MSLLKAPLPNVVYELFLGLIKLSKSVLSIQYNFPFVDTHLTVVE